MLGKEKWQESLETRLNEMWGGLGRENDDWRDWKVIPTINLKVYDKSVCCACPNCVGINMEV